MKRTVRRWSPLIVLALALTVAVVLRDTGVWRYDGPTTPIHPHPASTTLHSGGQR